MKVTLRAAKVSAAFRGFVADRASLGSILAADHMLVLRHLLRQMRIAPATAARLCQRRQEDARDVLLDMEGPFGLLERGGNGREEYWTLKPEVRVALTEVKEPGAGARDRAAVMEEVLDAIRRRAMSGQEPLANAAVRRMTHLDRQQVNRLIHELVAKGQVRIVGHGRGARYMYTGPLGGGE